MDKYAAPIDNDGSVCDACSFNNDYVGMTAQQIVTSDPEANEIGERDGQSYLVSSYFTDLNETFVFNIVGPAAPIKW